MLCTSDMLCATEVDTLHVVPKKRAKCRQNAQLPQEGPRAWTITVLPLREHGESGLTERPSKQSRWFYPLYPLGVSRRNALPREGFPYAFGSLEDVSRYVSGFKSLGLSVALTRVAGAGSPACYGSARVNRMSDIPPINGSGNGKLAGWTGLSGLRSSSASAGGPLGDSAADAVEISSLGRMLSSLDQTDEVRTEKVAELRAAIADGSYVTEEKIAITAERLIEALRALAVG